MTYGWVGGEDEGEGDDDVCEGDDDDDGGGVEGGWG